MNSEKYRPQNTAGNVMIYIIIALALIGGLTMVLSRQNAVDSGTSLDQDKTELLTTKMVAYAGSGKTVLDQMMMSGTNIASLDYSLPKDTSFDTGTHYNQIFHPDGGGLGYSDADANAFTMAASSPSSGWYMGRFNNVEWTPTAADDVLFVAYDVTQTMCESIDKKITGSAAIPVVAAVDIRPYFIDVAYSGAANADFTTTECAACDGYPSLCVTDSGSSVYVYYNIISGQ